jgi:hypothetical protein
VSTATGATVCAGDDTPATVVTASVKSCTLSETDAVAEWYVVVLVGVNVVFSVYSPAVSVLALVTATGLPPCNVAV